MSKEEFNQFARDAAQKAESIAEYYPGTLTAEAIRFVRNYEGKIEKEMEALQ